MNKEQLGNLINTKVTSYRDYRIKYAELVINDKSLFLPLLELAFDETNEASVKVSWVLDFVSREKLAWFYQHLDFFTDNISKVKHDSIVRPMARICELFAKAHNSKKNTEIDNYLTKNHIDNIVETGFDWMISNQKVAVRAYTMEALFLFGKEIDWVHTALKEILVQDISDGSPAYKARAKKILMWIEKVDKRK